MYAEIMQGKAPTIEDIELDLNDAVLPANLLCNENLSIEEAVQSQSPPVEPYKVQATCYACGTVLRLFVVSSSECIRGLEELLFRDLNLLCAACGRQTFQSHGR